MGNSHNSNHTFKLFSPNPSIKKTGKEDSKKKKGEKNASSSSSSPALTPLLELQKKKRLKKKLKLRGNSSREFFFHVMNAIGYVACSQTCHKIPVLSGLYRQFILSAMQALHASHDRKNCFSWRSTK